VTDRSGGAGQMRAEVDDAWRRCLGDEQTAPGNRRSRSNVASRGGGSRAAATRRAEAAGQRQCGGRCQWQLRVKMVRSEPCAGRGEGRIRPLR
jgi:hypothetical protein